MIQSLENSKVKLLYKLKSAKYRRKEQLFVVEGDHLVDEAQKAGVLVEAYSTIEREGYIGVSEAIMKKICNTDTIVQEIGLCKMIQNQAMSKHILILDGIQDPGNMGTLMRSACAFGFETIFIGEGSVDIYNDKVIRSSQGAIFKLNFLFGNPKEFIQSLKGYQVYGTNVIKGISLEQIEKEEYVAVVLGNEGNGISEEVFSIIDNNIYIPMKNTESLNVAIAGSIVMYWLR